MEGQGGERKGKREKRTGEESVSSATSWILLSPLIVDVGGVDGSSVNDVNPN